MGTTVLRLFKEKCAALQQLGTPAHLYPYPAFLPFVALIVGTLAASAIHLDLLPVWSVCTLMILVFLVFRRQWKVLGGWGTVGAVLTFLHLLAPWNSYKRTLLSDEGFAEIEAVVTDHRLLGAEDLQWLEPARNIEAKIQRIRLRRSDPWTSCSGTVVIMKPEVRLEYGQGIRAAGALCLPPAAELPHQFDFQFFLRCRGVEHRFDAAELVIIHFRASGLRRLMSGILAVRSWGVRKLIGRVETRDDQAILAAMTLGLKSGMDHEIRRTFQRAGIIHLFAVSGLHVGAAFSILLLISTCCRVPYHIRHLYLPLVLLVYVLMTGGEASSMRAWVMLTIWSVARGLKLPSRPMNSVLIAGVILLLWNPLSLYQIGFQYSFLLVISILLGWSLVGEGVRNATMGGALVPLPAQGHRRYLWAWKRTVCGTIGAVMVFWVSGLGLSAWYNQQVLPFSLLNNLFAGMSAWLVLLISGAKIFIGVFPLGWLSDLLAVFLESILGVLRHLAQLTAEFGVVPIARPSALMLIVYYAGLLGLLLSPRNMRMLSRRFLLMLALGTLLCSWRGIEQGRVTVFHPAGMDIPVVVIHDADQCVLVNVGPRMFAYSLINWLEGQGIREVDHVVLFHAAPETDGGLKTLCERMTVKRVTVPGIRRSRSHKSVAAIEQLGCSYQRMPIDDMIERGNIEVVVHSAKRDCESVVVNVKSLGKETVVRWQRSGKSGATLVLEGSTTQTFDLRYHNKDKYLAITNQ